MRPFLFSLFTVFLFLATAFHSTADCPDRKIFGDQSSENFLEFGNGEQVYRFYFQKSGYAKYHRNKNFQLFLPGLGSISGPLAHLNFHFEKILGSDYDAYNITLEGSESLAPYPCIDVSKIFEEGDSVVTDVKNFLFTKQANSNEGTFKTRFELKNRHNPNEYIKCQWEANKIIDGARAELTSKNDESKGYISQKGKAETLKFSWIQYNGNQNTLKCSLKPPHSRPIVKTIKDFQGPGKYIQMEQGEALVYHVKKLEPGEAKVTIRNFSKEKLNYNPQSFFSPDLPAPDSLNLENLGIYANTKTKNVTYIPPTSPVRYHGLRSNQIEPGLDLTNTQEKEAQYHHQYARIKPSDQEYFAHYKSPDRTNAFGIDDKARSFFLFPNVTLKPNMLLNPNSNNPSDYNRALTTYQQFKALKREFEQADTDTSDYLEDLKELWQEKNLMGKSPKVVTKVEKAFQKALLEKHQQTEGLEIALQTLASPALDDYPVKLKIDKKSGLPVERTHRLPDNTKVSINYEDQVKITAENEKQGKHVKTLSPVDSILDFHQFHHNLAYLPLEQGFKSRLPFMGIKYKDTTLQGKEDQELSKMVIEPVYLVAFLDIKDIVEMENSEGEKIKAFKLNMEFRGAVNQYPPFELLNAGKGPSYRLTYFLREEAPHRIITVKSKDHDQLLKGTW